MASIIYPLGYKALSWQLSIFGKRFSTTPSAANTSCWWTFGQPGAGPAGCSPPTFSKISEIHADIVFAKVDTEAEPGLSAAARITSISTLMAFREGILVFSQPGAMNAAGLEQLISSIKELDMEEVRAEMAAATVS